MSKATLQSILHSAERNVGHMVRNAPQDHRGQEFAKAAHAAISDLSRAVIELHKRIEELEEKQ